MNFKRRNFFKMICASPLMLLGVSRMQTFANVALTESDPTGQALCFKLNAKSVDKKDARCARFEPSQNCANCQLFQGKPGDKSAPCTIFQNKIVPAQGWCSAWVKKA